MTDEELKAHLVGFLSKMCRVYDKNMRIYPNQDIKAFLMENKHFTRYDDQMIQSFAQSLVDLGYFKEAGEDDGKMYYELTDSGFKIVEDANNLLHDPNEFRDSV